MMNASDAAGQAPDAGRHGPLAGMNILELASIGPVPFAGRILQQMGARITIVQPPSDRGLGLPVAEEYDYLNRGKDRTSLDLKTAQGREQLMARVRDADVLLEGFRPGVLERLSLSPDVLHQHNPRLVIGRCSGWGEQSPRAPHAGHDINFLALSGALAGIGEDVPVPPLNLVGDFGGAAMHLVAGVLAALLQRERDQRGVVVQTSIYEGAISLMSMIYGLSDAGQWQAARQSNILDGGAPYYRCYQTSDGKWMAVGAIEPPFFKAFIELLGLNVDLRRQNDRSYWPELRDKIAARMRTRTRDEWNAVFENTDACCTPVLGLDECRQPGETAAFFHDGDAGPAVTFR